MIRWENMQIDGLKVVRCDAELGDVFELQTPNGWAFDKRPYMELIEFGGYIQTSEADPEPQTHIGPFTNVNTMRIPPGSGLVRREVITPSFRYYCVSNPDLRKLNVTELSMSAGQQSVIDIGSCLLFVGAAKVMGMHLDRGFVDAVILPATIVAHGNVLGLNIKRV